MVTFAITAILGEMSVNATESSGPTWTRDRDFVLIVAKAEDAGLHRHADTKGMGTSAASFDSRCYHSTALSTKRFTLSL